MIEVFLDLVTDSGEVVFNLYFSFFMTSTFSSFMVTSSIGGTYPGLNKTDFGL